MTLTAAEINELAQIVQNGNLEKLKSSIKEPDQEVMNQLLVKALLSGKDDIFFYLLNEATPRADIASLSNDRINTYLSPNDFNIAKPPFSAEEEEIKVKGAGKILDYIHTDGFKDINLPAMAAYFGTTDIMGSLIKDGTKKWDFSKSIGHRPTTPLSFAINDGSERCKTVAFQIIDAADRIGVNISEQRTGIASLCALGEVAQAQEYISKMGAKPLSIKDIEEIIVSLGVAFNNCHDDPSKIDQLNKIADKIGEDISKHYKDQITSVLESIGRHWEVASDQSTSHIQLDTDEKAAAFQKLLIKAIPTSDLIPDQQRIHKLVGNISQLGNSLDSGMSTPEPKSPESPSNSPRTPGFLERVGTRVGLAISFAARAKATEHTAAADNSIKR